MQSERLGGWKVHTRPSSPFRCPRRCRCHPQGLSIPWDFAGPLSTRGKDASHHPRANHSHGSSD
jgi:hypothetical protein